MAKKPTFAEKQLDRAKSPRDSPAGARECRAGLVVLHIAGEGAARKGAAELFGIDAGAVHSGMEGIRRPDAQKKGAGAEAGAA